MKVIVHCFRDGSCASALASKLESWVVIDVAFTTDGKNVIKVFCSAMVATDILWYKLPSAKFLFILGKVLQEKFQTNVHSTRTIWMHAISV
jgi:hypothetical protein